MSIPDTTQNLCARCQQTRQTLVVRTEHLCFDCFDRYVATKMLKRIEANRIRANFHESTRLVLVPVSFGLSSICLLSLLHDHLKSRRSLGRHPGFDLRLLHVDLASVSSNTAQLDTSRMEDQLKQTFPEYPVEIIKLEDCESYNVAIPCLKDMKKEQSQEKIHNGKKSALDDILMATKSVTAAVDVIDILLRRIIQAYAVKANCSTILYADSTTRLAERTLAETAKGRGAALPSMISDTTDATSELQICYPLRDLMRNELEMYAGLDHHRAILSPLIQVCEEDSTKSAAFKNTSIDALMRRYFTTIERPYPSTLANVVRTANKLDGSKTATGISNRICDCCVCPINPDSWAGNQQGEIDLSSAGSIPEDSSALCYGCARSLAVR